MKQQYVKLNTLVAVEEGMGRSKGRKGSGGKEKEMGRRAKERGRSTSAMATPGPSKKPRYVQDTLVTGRGKGESKGRSSTFKCDGRKGKGKPK